MFAKYYQDELAWLREMGAEMAAARPEMARYLAEPGADPDVERLLEGFAFLTGRIRQKLDDEFPELTHGLMDMFCPHYLRPIPSMAILQVRPKPNTNTQGVRVARGTLVDSVPVDGTRCRFRTVRDLVPAPVEIVDVAFASGHPSVLRLRIRPRGRGGLEALSGQGLRVHLAGDAQVGRALLVALCHHVKRVVTRPADGAAARVIPVRVTTSGHGEDEAALPMPRGTFQGFRLLQEYFAFPERFLFVDVHGLEHAADRGGEVVVEFEFQHLPSDMPPIGAQNLQLDCVPAINLFHHEADPIRAQAGRTEYRVRPAGKNPEHYEVFSIEGVEGRARGATKQEVYRPFFAFEARTDQAGRFYQARRREALRAAGTDTYLRLGAADAEAWSDLDTISVDLVCTNRDLPTRLGPGDISVPTPEAPTAFLYRNLGSPTSPVPPPVGDNVHWRLLAHLTLNLRRLGDRDALAAALSLYDFRARVDRQARRRLDNLLTAILEVRQARGIELFDGIPISGTDTTVRIDEEKVGGEGEAFLFGSILEAFLAQYGSLNSYSRLRLECAGNHETFAWPARIGRRTTL